MVVEAMEKKSENNWRNKQMTEQHDIFVRAYAVATGENATNNANPTASIFPNGLATYSCLTLKRGLLPISR